VTWIATLVIGLFAFLAGWTAKARRQPQPLLPPAAELAARARSIDAVRDLAARGKKIPAIKAYRAATGAGLREAKEAVEALQRELRSGAAS
jgi:ribosomal protein L7/L12